jgi:hypothetical protein
VANNLANTGEYTTVPRSWRRPGLLCYSGWQMEEVSSKEILGAETFQKRGPLGISPERLPEFAESYSPETLISVFQLMARTAGPGAGPDGIGPRDVSLREIAGPIRHLSRATLAGSYRTMPTRTVSIPKAGGQRREIQIGTLLDRVLATALNTILTPFIDRVFLDSSYGFRPGRSHHHALAAVAAAIEQEKKYIVAADDIRGAFDHVLVEPLLEDVDRVVPDPDYRRLLSAVIKGHDGQRKRGIDQGGPLGPLLLNIHLHHRHDLPVAAYLPSRCWARYADNLIYLTSTVPEGLAALGRVRELLSRVELTLKGDPGVPVDIREQSVKVLGFDLSCEGTNVRYAVPATAWDELAAMLDLSHEEPNPPALARALILGWTYACAPAIGNYPESFAHQAHSLASRYGFGGTVPPDHIRYGAVKAGERWNGLLTSTGRSEL